MSRTCDDDIALACRLAMQHLDNEIEDKSLSEEIVNACRLFVNWVFHNGGKPQVKYDDPRIIVRLTKEAVKVGILNAYGGIMPNYQIENRYNSL